LSIPWKQSVVFAILERMADYRKPDYWSIRAHKEGYPARSVYKLQEMEEKFHLFRDCRRILDLGAAPGSWSLYIIRKILSREGPSGGIPLLAAVDLVPLSRQYDRGLFEGEQFCFIQGDLGSPEVRERVLSLGPYGLLLSDAAPATTGNRGVDTARSLALAEGVLSYLDALEGGGSLVLKIFQGGDTAQFLASLREQFRVVKTFKPQACRRESFEVYAIGLGKRGETPLSTSVSVGGDPECMLNLQDERRY